MLQNLPVLAAGRAAHKARRVLTLAAIAVIAACSKDQPEPRATSSVKPPAAAVAPRDSAAAPAAVHWEESNGSALYIPGTGGVVQVVVPPVMDDSVPRPDSAVIPAGAAPASVDLFAPAGKVATVSLGEYASASQPTIGEACDAWAIVPVRDAPGVTPQSWRVALQAGVAEAIATDSLGSLSRADSAMLVVDINKAAAMLPLDSAGVLRRVPFGVSRAYRLRLGEVETVIAVVERRLNLEAEPRVERSLLVLERQPKVKGFTAVWRETQFAAEDDLIALELMAVVTFRGTGRPTVFVSQDFGDGSRVQMLQRSPGGIWTLQWSSAYTGC